MLTRNVCRMAARVTTPRAGVAGACSASHPKDGFLAAAPIWPSVLPSCGMSLISPTTLLMCRQPPCQSFPVQSPLKRSLAFRARAGAQLLGWLLLGKTPACGPVACQRVSCAANGGCGWKTVLEQYWLASHPLQCILYPAVLSSSRLAHNQPDLALPLSSFFSSFFGSLVFFWGGGGCFISFFFFETCNLDWS